VIPGSIFLIYGLEFHKLSFSKYVSAVQKARNRKKTKLNIPERMTKRKRTLGQTMVYIKLQKIKDLAIRKRL
jgi:catechol-2,3-dioxygenase